MKLGKTKWVYLRFIPYEFKGVEEYLDSMALKGWKLEKIRGEFLKFKKIEPAKLKYTVDVIDEIAFIDGENTEISMEYREYCNMVGWEFICEKDKIQVYCREFSENSIPIHTEDRERFEIIKKASKKYVFASLMGILFLIFVIYKITLDGSFLARNMDLFSVVSISVITITYISEIIYYISWNLKAKTSLRNGDEICYPSLKKIKIKLQNYMSITLIISLVIYIGKINSYYIKTTVFMCLMYSVPYIVRKFINKSDGNNIKRRSLYMETMIYAFFIGVVVIIIVFSSGLMNYKYSSNKVLSNKIEAITVEDLGYKIKNEQNTNIEENSSIFADNIFYHVESNAGFMGYTLFRSEYKWAVDYKLKSEFNMLKKLSRKFNEDISYKEVETEYSKDGITIYSNKYGNSLIIVSDNIYLDIGCWDEDMINSDILKIVLDKIFKVKSA